MAHQKAGIGFPYRNEGKGIPFEVKGVDVVHAAFRALLHKRKRTSVMDPNLGLNVHSYVFDSTGPLLRAKIQRDIAVNTAEYVPQVNLLAIDVFEDGNKVMVNITYSVQGIVNNESLEIVR